MKLFISFGIDLQAARKHIKSCLHRRALGDPATAVKDCVAIRAPARHESKFFYSIFSPGRDRYLSGWSIAVAADLC
ncbi:MAG: hypothetical protein WCE73_16660, partial [Candidatus Angelobacter sp.]